MFSSHGDLLVCQARYQDLLREAEKERLIRAAGLRPANKGDLPRQMANWLGAHLVKWGLNRPARRPAAPSGYGDCCLVELKPAQKRASLSWPD